MLVVLGVSLALQCLAAAFAWRTARRGVAARAWTLLAAAMLLIAVMRCIDLNEAAAGLSSPQDLVLAVLWPLVSALLLLSFVHLQPVLAAMRLAADELESAREAERQFSQQLRALLEVSNELSRAGSMDELCRSAVELGREQLGFERLSVWFCDEDPAWSVGMYGTDEQGRTRDERGMRVSAHPESAMGQAYRSPERQIFGPDRPLYNQHGEEVGRGSVVLSCLWDGHAVVGYLVCDNHLTHRPFTPHDAELLSLYGSKVGSLARQKQAEERLAEAEALLSAAVYQSPAGVIIVSADGRVRVANEAAIGGPDVPVPASLDEIQDTIRSGQLRLACADGRVLAPEEAYLYRALRHGETTRDVEVVVERRGVSRCVLTNAAPVHNAAGEVVAAVLVLTDITQRKQAEAERAALAGQVQEAARLESVGRLAGGIAHDFNNLLTTIIGFGQLLEMGFAPDSPERDDVEQILRAADHAAQLTRQLLTFSRRQVVELQPVDLNQCYAALERMIGRVTGGGIELSTSLAPDLHPVSADPHQMQQVLMNLVLNARDAMPDGGRLTLQTANATLDDSPAEARLGLPAGEYVRLTLSDTGPGVAAEHLEHIFEPFYSTKGSQGTGLGLATCYGIVTQSRGTIECQSTPGEGAAFRVYLPALVGAKVELGPAADAVRGRGETILVVEDEESVRRLVVRALEGLDYRVLAAPDPASALALLEQEDAPIDLLLTDVVMPGMGGPELARRILVDRRARTVLYMSGYPEHILNEGTEHPGAGLLPKPFTAEALARRVRAALDGPAER